MRLNREEKKELRDLAYSLELREDMKRLLVNRYNPFVINGKVDIDAYITFLTEYNFFINHIVRPFRKIIDIDMRM